MKIWFNYYFLFVTILVAQPRKVENGIEFSFKGTATSVALAGDFNSWQTDADLLKKDKNGTWRIVKKLISGVYQYKFVIDGHNWRLDENNPIKVPNYNNSDYNSIITITDNGDVVFKGYEPTQTSQTSDNYSKTGKTLYLNIIWHQHQPLYLDPQKDQLQGPWVRTHGTKDYYDMAAMVEQYPNVHFNVNLTSSLLYQLQKYYVERLAPYYDANRNRINTEKYFSQFRGKTDPWIDLALKPTKEFNEKDKAYLLTDVWNAFGISEVMISRFPQYSTLKNKLVQQKSASAFSEQELRDIKFWFYLAYFDPDFLRGKATLPDGSWIDLTDLVEEHEGPTFYLKRTISEDDCNRIIAETYKVMSNIIPIHRKLMYNPVTFLGQIEIVTTPFYHPILPLIYDSDLAKICQPKDALPKRFSYPQDAFAQVAKSVVFYEEMFGRKPQGMWPAEGSVAQEVVSIFAQNGIKWIATDEKTLYRSTPNNQPKYYPYGVSTSQIDSVVVVFRDTELSDKIGFTYQNFKGEDGADNFIKSILQYVPKENEQDRLLTVILDGENAWEWYRYDIDGKEFLNSLYRKLSKLYDTRQIITVTTSEYIQGNPNRGILPHPISAMPKLQNLWQGSWINANYDTWIGEPEENQAWEYLRIARNDLENSGIQQPNPKREPPPQNTKEWFLFNAWEAMYAAEGSDWFWWYGTDQSAPAGDKPFDDAFTTHLKNVYDFAKKGGVKMPKREFNPIIKNRQSQNDQSQGVMAKSKVDSVKIKIKK